jgi:trk system potassium uptake protein TrkH
MGLFDAVTHAFTTLSTGGFSVRNASMAAYDSAYIQYVTIVFMYLAGINFTLHYRAVTGRPARYLTDAEWRAYTLILLGAAALMVPPLLVSGQYSELGIERAIRDALFQSVSIGTTTGYVSYDYEIWPASTNLILLLLMFIGGMAGSTAGGMKVIRVYAFAKQGVTALKRSLHPRAVLITRIGQKPIRETDLLTILAFILFFLALFFFGALALTLLGNEFVTSIGASAATLGNIGPGLGDVGAGRTFRRRTHASPHVRHDHHGVRGLLGGSTDGPASRRPTRARARRSCVR